MAEVEAALGTVLGAETPAEGFRKLVTRQSTGAAADGGNWASVGVVQHRVHSVEGAGAEAGEEETVATALMEQEEEEWEQQAGWSKAARGKKQVLEEGQENALVGELWVEQAGVSGKAQAQKEKAAAESYEKRQMLWKGMAGRSWSEMVEQWGVPQVEALQLQKSIASLMREVGPKLGGGGYTGRRQQGWEGRAVCCQKRL
jgi:hypothetical protein